MSSQPPLIWFLLVDSITGQPYKNTTASSILSSSLLVPVIDQFRDAVKVKYADSHLKSIAPSNLLVYKNKASFDKRNAAEGKEEPLDPTESLGVLGSKEDMLIVLVPEPPQAGPSSFLECQEPFYTDLFNATESNGWISLGQNIPSTTLNTLYIRECYRIIASSIHRGINKAVITGTPGIGKSLFLIYLLVKLVKEGKRVFLVYDEENFYYDGQGGVFSVETPPGKANKAFWNPSLWLLFDAKGKTYTDLHKLPYKKCTFILSTSPRRDMMNDFKKPPEPHTFYMPTWTEAELEVIAPLFPVSNEWRNRFEILGGIPRHVLEVTTLTPTKILEAACTECSLDDCIEKIGTNFPITEKSKIIHSLVHVTSAPPFTELSVCYASPTALNIIVRHMGKEAKFRIGQLLESCEGKPLTSALCGYLFERYAIELLEKGGTFTCRKLVHGNTKIKPRKTRLKIPPSVKTVADKVLAGQTLNQLHVPKTTNYAAIDAWIPGIGAFQMTVGQRHDIKGGAKENLELLGEKANKLYWLLPPLYYDSFTKKSPQDIEQYAVLIPYPE